MTTKADGSGMTLGGFVQEAAARLEAAGLAFGHGTGNAFDEAAFIALEGLGLPIDGLDELWDRSLDPAERQRIDGLIAARISTRKPASYLLNRAYIQGLPFYVDERVIVPRSFIGEILCREDGFWPLGDYERIGSVLDLCTGSGCLAILAAHLFPQAEIDAVDISADAVEVARRNVDESGLSRRINIFKGDLFAPLEGRSYDLIIANPPYVDKTAMESLPDEYRHEPALALAGGADGLDLVRFILDHAPGHLNPGGGLLCEIGTGKEVMERDYPRTPFLWLDTEHGSGEVFWLPRRKMD